MRRVLPLLLALPFIASVVAAPSPTPSTRDVTVKTEQRLRLGRDAPTTTIATYFSGTRQRRETTTGGTLDETVHWVTITLCDENRTLILNPAARLYAYMGHEAPVFRRLIQPIVATPRPDPSGPKVIITVDAVDTEERRQVGSYVARRVKTTTTQSDGNSEKSVREQDGWYLDLPDMNCGRNGEAMLVLTQHASVHVEHRGTARRGYPIEETDRYDRGNAETTTKLVEFSEASLDDGLFTVPSGYRAALPLLAGHHDLTRPDTVGNRLASYWEGIVDWASFLFR